MWLAFFWYAQDLLQVLLARGFFVPELFFLALFFQGVTEEYDLSTLIWSAFLGGLLWDLRWSGLPGFTSVLYVAILTVGFGIWSAIPRQARTAMIVVLIAGGCHCAAGTTRVLLLDFPERDTLLLLILQQLMALPFLVQGGMWLMRKEGPFRAP
ncbi:MAG: hypothetical protein K9L28_01070 [Synergistales bacterium]|nr:hypothetical protein [Synergistales bacterium]